MPRANRHFLPGYVWHITHRCHEKKFLLKFARDRRRYLRWVFEAKKCFGLSVLNYTVTSNHVHLLVKDTCTNDIAQSMQLIAGRTAQEYNQRKGRLGAFWEDRYHTTAIDADEHLHRWLVYIDLNMVRAGVVNHPGEWKESGFCEIQEPPKHYAVNDLESVTALTGFVELRDFQTAHLRWVEQALENGRVSRDQRWSEAIAVGSLPFVEKIRSEVGMKALHRRFERVDGMHVLHEPAASYACSFTGESDALRQENTFFWDETVENAGT